MELLPSDLSEVLPFIKIFYSLTIDENIYNWSIWFNWKKTIFKIKKNFNVIGTYNSKKINSKFVKFDLKKIKFLNFIKILNRRYFYNLICLL